MQPKPSIMQQQTCPDSESAPCCSLLPQHGCTAHFYCFCFHPGHTDESIQFRNHWYLLDLNREHPMLFVEYNGVIVLLMRFFPSSEKGNN